MEKEVKVRKKMKKSTKIVALVLIGCIVLGLLTWLVVELIPFYGKKNYEFWVPTQTLALSDTVVLQKDPNRDFVVLNLTDIQYSDTLDPVNSRNLTDETVRRAVAETAPDLITVTGDMVWATPFTRHSINYFIALVDSFNIPWAPIFGNHDDDGNCDLAWFAERMMAAKNCLFKKGPANIGGIGNYIINIMEGEKIVHSMFMIDSGSSRYYPAEDKDWYDFVGAEKQAWYLWALRGLTALNANITPTSSLFLHIPLPEFDTAYQLYYNKETKQFDPKIGFGSNGEKVCAPLVNSGFFEVMLQAGSTKDVIAGHDHTNNASVLYKGIRLTYANKTGNRCYWDKDKNGGTKLTIKATGEMATEHVYIHI